MLGGKAKKSAGKFLC